MKFEKPVYCASCYNVLRGPCLDGDVECNCGAPCEPEPMVHVVEIVGDFPYYVFSDLGDMGDYVGASLENGNVDYPITVIIHDWITEALAMEKYPESFDGEEIV